MFEYVRLRDAHLWNPLFGQHLFWDGSHGDYLGRPANPSAKMAWYYNQVNDKSGMGATCTCRGLPLRMAKLSNFVVGYVTARMGVPDWAGSISQLFGTPNDRSAELSWSLGQSVDQGADFGIALSNCVISCWRMQEKKVARQWPCPLPAQNYVPQSIYVNPNHFYTSPGFLNMEEPEDFEY